MPIKISEAYHNKVLLLTGTTGFVGKVLLEKLLYSLPTIQKIYVVIRTKKGSTALQRFKKQILSSPCFNRIRDLHGKFFDTFIREKIYPIQGDIIKENLGVSEQYKNALIEQCNIILNCAASVDFNARLDQAIDSNIIGALNTLSLAKKMKKLQCFTHVSTCYVNCTQKGLVRQQIYQKYDYGFHETDPQLQLQQLRKYTVNQLTEAKTKEIIGDFPNTYTFTKNLCERLINKKRGDIPLCLVRPAIINNSYFEPFPGWIDSLAAASGLFFFVGLGVMKQLYGNPHFVGDMIPVDIVVNIIIVSAAFNLNNRNLTIVHASSSQRNPITYVQIRQTLLDYWTNNKAKVSVSKPSFFMSNKKLMVDLVRVKKRLPIWMYAKVAPILGSQYVKQVQRLLKGLQRSDEIQKHFEFFVATEWIFESSKIAKYSDSMHPEDKKTFVIDVAEINMKHFLVLNHYGLQKYILKQNVQEPSAKNYNVLKQDIKQTYFSDIKWALTQKCNYNKINFTRLKSIIMSSQNIKEVMNEEIKNIVLKQNIRQKQARSRVQYEAQAIINEIVGEFKLPFIRFMAWSLRKIFFNMYEKVSLNEEIFSKLRNIQENRNIPLVLVPTHKSYIDFLIVSYIFFIYKLKLPHVVVNEQLFQIRILPHIIRNAGAFFYKKKSYNKSHLYKEIFEEYIRRILIDGGNFQFFIEGHRSRTGKLLNPKLQILQILVNSVVKGQIQDVCIVPLTINYEKVMESDTFPSQLLGQEKVYQSLFKTVKTLVFLKDNFGRVYIEFCQPILLKSYIQKIETTNILENTVQINQKCKVITKKLGSFIIEELSKKIVILSTGIVSSVLLLHRRGIRDQLLAKIVKLITNYIIKKGYKVGGINQNSSTLAVRQALGILSPIISQKKRNILELQLKASSSFENILLLSYYRNTIIHVFVPECFIGCAFSSFGLQMTHFEGVPLKRLYQETSFLEKTLRNEFFINEEDNLSNQNNFLKLIRKMQEFNILSSKIQGDTEKIYIVQPTFSLIQFYCSLLVPLIQCYWSVLFYIQSICKSPIEHREVQSIEKFYNYLQWFVQNLYYERNIENYEACSLETIKNAFALYEKMKIVQIEFLSKKEIRLQIKVPEEAIRDLLLSLKGFLKISYPNDEDQREKNKSIADWRGLSKL